MASQIARARAIGLNEPRLLQNFSSQFHPSLRLALKYKRHRQDAHSASSDTAQLVNSLIQLRLWHDQANRIHATFFRARRNHSTDCGPVHSPQYYSSRKLSRHFTRRCSANVRYEVVLIQSFQVRFDPLEQLARQRTEFAILLQCGAIRNKLHCRLEQRAMLNLFQKIFAQRDAGRNEVHNHIRSAHLRGCLQSAIHQHKSVILEIVLIEECFGLPREFCCNAKRRRLLGAKA
mmetsp:Transcript_884/g.2429  ORF Transcript_884/g.2429 Transcript_884/m.2429 type:complete len:233 (-) Transcript_884:699-1397(-)